MGAYPNPLDAILDQKFEPALPTLHAYLDYHAAHKGDADAVTHDGVKTTWAELHQLSHQFVDALVNAGVTSGDCVAMMTPPNVDYFACYLACARLGAIWLGINPKYTRAEMAYVVGDAQPVIVLGYAQLGGRDYGDDLNALGVANTVFLDIGTDRSRFFDAPPSGDLAAVDPASAVLLVYTSGSSGAPKGALLTHKALITAAQNRIRAWQHDGWRMLLNVPVNHIGGAGDISCTVLVAGGMLACMEKFDAAGSLARIEQDKLTIWFQVPTQFRLSLDTEQAATADLSSLQAVVWSGAPAPRQLIDELANRFPGKLALDYSLTESVGAISMTPLTNDKDMLANSVGYPVPGRAFKLRDGQISIQDGHMFSGYLGKSHTEAFEPEGHFLTGDLGSVDAQGRLSLTGRAKEMYKSGGYNVYPREVETAIEAVEGVALAAVISVPDALYTEVGHAYVLPEKGADISAEVINRALRQQLANYKIPKKINVRSDLPLLPIGKIDKKALQAASRAT